jgi:hypothetical protein
VAETVRTATTKVVINGCYGGFSLSDEAKREYLRRTGQEWTEKPNKYSSMRPHFYVGAGHWSERDLPRTDPVLIAVVEDLGAEANGMCASLKIEEIEKGTRYFIDEYDGYEGIQTRSGIDWETA